MPRGPGKKENYNFDYSRFADVDHEEPPDDPGVPSEVFRQLPGELREAFRLMQVARQTGDSCAQERANELALKAVDRGGPEMKRKFEQELMKQAAENPDAKKSLEALLNRNIQSAVVATPSESLHRSADEMATLSGTLTSLQSKMKAGADRAAAQLEAIRLQQERLENIRSPEDFARVMAEQGLSEEDLQRALAGDEAHLKKCIELSFGKLGDKDDADTSGLEQVLGTVDQIHSSLLTHTPDATVPEMSVPFNVAVPEPAKMHQSPAPIIPEHRVQYHEDQNGKMLDVELKCELPGVRSLDEIEIDVSAKFLRLRTTSVLYVVNVGPFPALVDAPAAKAKFSRKKQALTLIVPAIP